jgi:hypothetical protein
VGGLRLSAEPLAVAGTIVLWLVLSGIGLAVLNLPAGQAIVGGLLAALLHWVSEFVHHLGHAWASQQTGYPMAGIRFGKGLVLAVSLYPPDERPLPATIHIRRALGGPVASLLLSLVAGLIAWMLYRAGGVLWWMAVFVCLENLLVLTIGALVPLGFTDGSTLLIWWIER